MASAKGNRGGSKRQATTRSKAAKSARDPVAWRTFFLGCAAGALVCVAWYEGWFQSRKATPGGAATEAEKTTAKANPKFDFYTILPEKEVVIRTPKPPPKPSTTTAQPEVVPRNSETTPVQQGRFMIQVGSFRTNAQADELRAKLALSGIEAGTQRVSDDKGQTWHRVRIGPFTRLQAVQEQMARLEAQSLGGMVFKLKE